VSFGILKRFATRHPLGPQYLRRHLALEPAVKCVLFISDAAGIKAAGVTRATAPGDSAELVIGQADPQEQVLGRLEALLARLYGQYRKEELLILFVHPFRPFSYFNGWSYLQHRLAVEDLTVSYLEPFLWTDGNHPFFSSLEIYLRGLARTDYLEFGTYVGTSMSAAYHALNGRMNRFFAFDGFSGLIGTNAVEKEIFGDGQYSVNERSLIHNLRYANVDTTRVVTHKVDFLELGGKGAAIREQHKLERSLVVHIDCDLYEPTRACLEFVRDILQQGTFLLLDDYNSMYASNARGMRRALAEFKQSAPDLEFELHSYYGPHQAAFIVHRERA
jgi:hypothetical protein